MIRIFAILLLLPLCINAQKVKMGVKAGLNFMEKPELDVLNTSLTDLNQQVKDQNQGYHLGLFTQFEIASIYLRPEAYITFYKTEYVDANSTEFSVKSNRLDVPVLVGKEFFDFLYAHAGVVGSYYFEDRNSLSALSQANEDQFSFGVQIGGGINLKKISLDVRWEKPVSDRISDFVTADSEYEIKSNPTQFLVSVGYTF